MSSLDHQLLRVSHPGIAGPYLHRVATDELISTYTISQELLHAVAKQSLPPQVYELWLGACPDETAIILGLQQSHSVIARRGAIKAFRRWFRTSRCIDIWRAVGGTEGIIHLLASFSVEHVREFCKTLGRCSTSTALRHERQQLVTELMYCLTSRFFPQSAKVSNPDERPLWYAYGGLVYACTPEARDAWIFHKTLPKLDMTKVMESDTEHFQQQCLTKAAAGDKDLERYSPLLVSLPAKTSEVDATVPQSMEFAASFLETLAEHDVELVRRGGERKLPYALRTIVTRLARRDISAEFALEMVTLISTRAKDMFVAEATAYTSDYDKYLTDVARLWMRNPNAYEAPLSQLLKTSDMIQMRQLCDVILIVAQKDRYRLLRWLVLTQHNVDIDDARQLTRFRMQFIWSLLVALPKPEARALVDRIVSVKGEGETWLHPILSDVQMPDTGVQLDMLRYRLADDNDERNEEAKLKIAQYQRLAEKDREAQGRLEWITAAGYMAVVAGSLDLLREVLLWARRFNRDHVVIQGFYGRWTFLRKPETLDLLSGMPEKPFLSTNQTAVGLDVCKGNGIALLLLETAAMCQNEPSFYATHWSELQHLLADIVRVRMQRIRRLKHQVGMLHDDKVDFVWQPTLEALLDAERLGLDERNQALQFNDMHGPLDIWRDVEVEDPDISVLWFLNELARRRDATWQKHRFSVRPDAMTLESPWPRGLPVQALLSVHIKGKVSQGNLRKNIPFVMERAQSVVFMPKNVALRAVPEDKEQKAAIGCFVEDYIVALQIHIMGCGKVERQERSEVAWTYAITELSAPRLSPREAVMYWERVFNQAGAPIPKHTLDLRPAPNFPQVDVHDDKPEWQPDAGPYASIRTRKLHPISLDCSTSPTSGETLHDAFVEPTWPYIQRSDVPNFWNFSRYGSGILSDHKDAYIAAGLLLIDSISQAGGKLLSEPFPDRVDIRFPAVYLDSDFVENQRSFEAFPPVLLNDTPPALLDQLASALIAKLCDSKKPTPALVRWTFTTLKLLAWSDNPELTIRHIVHVVVGLPDHSSWHRVMLHPGVLRRLSAQHTRTLVAGLADAINENSRQRKADQATSDSAPANSDRDAQLTPKPYVKVTTVKLLAQLMRHAEFIGESFTVEILVKLFTESTHVDIRAAVVDSLVAIAISTKTPSIEEKVISMLETHAIPLAAELAERSPMTEQSWAECEEKCESPAIESGRPIREAVLAFLRQIGYQKNTNKMREMVRRLLLPLIQKAATNAQRWLKIVLRANNATHLYADIPVAFGAIDLHELLLDTYTEHMPAADYDEFHKLMVFFARASNTYQELSKIFNAMDPPPHAHDAQQRLFDWASDRNCDPEALEYDPNVPALFMHNTFATAEDAATHDLLTPAQLQAHEREMFDIRLERFGQEPGRWSSIVNSYEPPLRRREDFQLAWYTYCRPLVESMVSRIETTRTPAWQQDPHRQPSRLPDAFPLRLWLLSYPSRPWRADAEQEQRKQKFATEVLQLLAELASSGKPYHAHFALVVAAAKKCYEKDWAAIALLLGSLGDWEESRELTLHELLRIELADLLLQGAKQPVSERVMEGVRLMLEDWSCCFDEGARDRAIVTAALLGRKARNGVKDALPWFPWEA